MNDDGSPNCPGTDRPINWADELERTYQELRTKNGVMDVKLAFASTSGKTSEELFRGITVALEKIVESEGAVWTGLGDSYGLKPNK